MTQYKCDCCDRTEPASDWIHTYDDNLDEHYVICPECGSEACEYEEEYNEEEEEQ